MKTFVPIVYLSGLSLLNSSACDLCSIYSATQARGEIGAGFSAGFASQYTHFNTLKDAGERVSNDADQKLDSTVSQLFVGYNFSDRVGVQLNIPLIHRFYQRAEDTAIERGVVSGIGDIALVGHYQVIRHEAIDSTFTCTLLSGVKLPTGDSGRLQEEVDELSAPPLPPGATESGIHGHDLALGSGSVDGIVGAGMFGRWKRAFATANLQYAIRSKGDFEYRYANDLTWSAGPGMFLVFSEQNSLSVQLLISGETKTRDTFQGDVAEDTGITSVFVGPQINYTCSDKLSAEFGADFPVSIKNTALQLVPDYRLRAAMTWHF